LTTLHTTGDHVDTFTVTGNDALTAIDVTGLDDFGTTAEPAFDLWDNDLTATTSNNTYDGETATSTTGADGGTADAGSWDDGTSGMDSMKAYLTALAAEADSDGYAGYDTVTTLNDTEANDGTTTTTLNVTGPTTYTAGTTSANGSTVLHMIEAVANSSDQGSDAIAEQQAFQLDWLATGTIQLTANGLDIFDTTVGGAGTALSIATSNLDLQISAIKSAVNLERAAAANVTLNAKRGYGSSATVSLAEYTSGGVTSTILGERYTTGAAANAAVSTTNYGFGLDDSITFSVGSNSTTYSLGTGGMGETATTIADIGDGIVAGWALKYGAAGTHSASAIATLTDTDGSILVTMLQADSAGYDQLVSMSVTAGTTTASNAANLDWQIGGGTSVSLTDDNKTDDTDIIVTVASTAVGVDETTISTLTTTGGSGATVTWVALSTNYTANETWTGGTGANAYAGTQVERTDVISAEDSVAATTSNAVAQTLFNRVTWLG